MTGYGRATVVGNDFTVSVDLKTVNNRFLDVHLRMSNEWAAMEPAVKRRISARLARGRVDVTVNLERTAAIQYELNRPLIAGYVDALRTLQQEFDIPGELDINSLARLPGALQTARDGVTEAMTAGVERAIDEGLAELERMREQEGAALKEEMASRIAKIETLVPVLEKAAAGLVETYRLRLQKRISELLNRDGQVMILFCPPVIHGCSKRFLPARASLYAPPRTSPTLIASSNSFIASPVLSMKA